MSFKSNEFRITSLSLWRETLSTWFPIRSYQYQSARTARDQLLEIVVARVDEEFVRRLESDGGLREAVEGRFLADRLSQLVVLEQRLQVAVGDQIGDVLGREIAFRIQSKVEVTEPKDQVMVQYGGNLLFGKLLTLRYGMVIGHAVG